MKTLTIILLSHSFAAALAAAGAFVAVNNDAPAETACIVLAIAFAIVWIQCWLLVSVFKRYLKTIVRAVASAGEVDAGEIKAKELEVTASELCEIAQRWSETASASRRRLHEFEELSTLLDRRSNRAEGRAAGNRIGVRRILGGIADAADSDLEQIFACIDEITQSVHGAVGDLEDQFNSLTKTATCIEQVSSAVSTIQSGTGETRKSLASLENRSNEASGVLIDLLKSIDGTCDFVSGSQHKLQVLEDHYREIHSVVETISAVAARTDLLALNASIESVRAGEHGRGFAVVADEVHRLAEQTSLATREAAALIESSESEIRQAIAVTAKQQSELERAIERVDKACLAIDQIKSAGNVSSHQVGDLEQAITRQVHVMREITTALAQMAEIAKSTRAGTEKARWATKSLEKHATDVDGVLEPLRSCGGTPRRAPRQNNHQMNTQSQALAGTDSATCSAEESDACDVAGIS